MTPEQHQQRIRQLEFQLHKADYGMGMPRDYNEVLRLTVLLNEARKEATKYRPEIGWLAAGLRAAIAKAEGTS